MDQIKCPTTKSVNIRFLKNDKRIDIYISEPGKYAIIMENKVMDAVEQPHQLANYIEGLNVLGFANHQIYIAYLPSTNDVSPSENSWTNRKKLSYRQEFSDRFNNISFRDGILPWLKFIELPDSEDSLLPKAVSMYIDYLEGLFGLRPNDYFIEMKTEEYIAEKLKFSQDPIKDLQKGLDAVTELESLKKELMQLNMKQAHIILKKWLEKAEKNHPTLPWEDRSQNNQFPNIGFPIAYGEWTRAFKVFIQIDPWHNLIYYGIYLAEQQNMPFAEAKDLLRSSIDPLDKFEYQTGAKIIFARANAAESYEKFERLVRLMLKIFKI